jgi:hypothetical protein
MVRETDSLLDVVVDNDTDMETFAGLSVCNIYTRYDNCIHFKQTVIAAEDGNTDDDDRPPVKATALIRQARRTATAMSTPAKPMNLMMQARQVNGNG